MIFHIYFSTNSWFIMYACKSVHLLSSLNLLEKFIFICCFLCSNFYVKQLLGRTIDLRSLVAQRMNKIFRENLEFLFDRFESQDLCAILVSSFFSQL